MSSDERIYPYLIEPKEVAAIWGGDALAQRYGKPAGEKIGESWECWDENAVANGPLKGKTIAELRQDLGAELCGALDPSVTFPVLTKFIDARDSLSVQVHPDDAYAQRVERQPNGKTECWYILEAQPEASLVLGWTRDTDRTEYERRVADGTLGELLRRVPVKAGDVYYLPAGTLHAIGAGIVLYETQQSSDLTYRIFDWNRRDARGNARPLHIEKAADVLDYAAARSTATVPLEYWWAGADCRALVANEYFTLELITFAGDVVLELNDRPLVLTALGAPLVARAEQTETNVPAYATTLIPAAAGSARLSATESARVLRVVPGERKLLQERLKVAGVSAEATRGFLAQFASAATQR